MPDFSGFQLAGRRCPESSIGRPPTAGSWVGWKGEPADPRSPDGGGGPGGFVRPSSLCGAESWPPTGQDPAGLIHPQAPQTLHAAPVQLASAKKNPPPTTQPQKKKVLSKQSSLMDVEVFVEVVADGSTEDSPDEGGANFSPLPGYQYPGFEADPSNKITKFTGKFTWKGTVVVQTVYGPGASASDYSCYGRGTTDTDLQNGDITLGFHESCHQKDYIKYLEDHALPDLKVGMTVAEFNRAIQEFKTKYDSYKTSMKQYSEANTHEVGYKKSEYDRTRDCYVHGSGSTP